MLFILLLRPIWDVDIFWQLRLGELILQQGGPVTREPFAALHLGEALAPVAWLGQAIYAQLRLLFGWTGLRIFDAIVWLGGFWAVAAACRRRGAAALAVAFALVIAFAPALPTASIRPQSFAALGFGVLLALLRLELPPVRTLLFAAPLFVLWQNLHPSVTVAVVVLGAAAGVAWLKRFARHGSSRPWLLTALTVLAAASVFATPAGVSILGVSADNAWISAAMGVSEWLPIWSPLNRPLAVSVAAVALVTGWLLARNRGRIDWEELVPVLVLFVMTLTAYRFVLFWSITLVPVLARALSVPGPPPRRSWRGRLVPPTAAAAAVGLSLLVSPTHFSEAIPLAGIRKLAESGVRGTIFDHFEWGGPLIDAGYPNWTVTYDGRYYRYSPAEWRRYDQARRGEIGPAELDRIYHPSAYVLKPGYDAALIAALQAAPAAWRRIYADPACVVFVRSQP
ncbi:MAG: hypothetical protein WDM85_08730 [Caulobacteraceae bacterium]